MAKFKEERAKEFAALRETGASWADIAKPYGLTREVVRQAVLRLQKGPNNKRRVTGAIAASLKVPDVASCLKEAREVVGELFKVKESPERWSFRYQDPIHGMITARPAALDETDAIRQTRFGLAAAQIMIRPMDLSMDDRAAVETRVRDGLSQARPIEEMLEELRSFLVDLRTKKWLSQIRARR